MPEGKRGCGYRKIGGLYLFCDGPGVPCDALPYPLDVCPVCSAGIKFSRGWTWVSRALFVINPNVCSECTALKFGGCAFVGDHDRLGLLWVGEAHYKTPGDFTGEADRMGISRRINSVPRGFKIGETWVALAHIKAVRRLVPVPEGVGSTLPGIPEYEHSPGIFRAFLPSRIEYIVTEDMLKSDEIQKRIETQKLTPVVVEDIPRHRTGKDSI